MSGFHNTKTQQRNKRKRLLEVLAESNDDTILEICRKAGIQVSTYYKYIKDPKFQEVINSWTRATCTANKPKTLRALFSRAQAGEVSAIRTALELDGTLKGANNQTVNVGINTQEPDKAYDNPQEALKAAYRERDRLNSVIATLERVAGKVEVEPVEVVDHAIHPEQEDGGGA